MYIILILFFGSLIGITAMIGKKIFSFKKEPPVPEQIEEFHLHHLDLGKIRHIVLEHTREYSYITIVAIIRFYIRFSKILKREYKKIIYKIQTLKIKHLPRKKEEKIKEASGFLKKISEYKHKIKKIKNKVVEEEKQNTEMQ